MGLKDKIYPGDPYFLTATVVDWVDVFTRQAYKQIIVDSLNHCVAEKGLIIYAWVLMTNHLHLVAAASDQGPQLSGIVRDFKKFTSKAIVKQIHEEPESRRQWMLHRFAYSGRYDPKIKDYRFWQEGNEPKVCYEFDFLKQKIDHTHFNPVKAGIVLEPEHYYYSSAMDYAGIKGLVNVVPAW